MHWWDGKRKKSRGKKGSRGIITVFVTLMMVPVVTITGMMVDLARLKMYSTQSVMAADSFGEAVLSEYDNLLKELYGLFSVTQNQKGLDAITALNQYICYSFQPNGGNKGLSGFMPYKDADVQLAYAEVAGASLQNKNVLMTQIGDFMKFRIVQELGEGMGILDALGQVQSCGNDMDAMEARADITDSGMKALQKIQEYYQQLKILSGYNAYTGERKSAFEAYAKVLKDIVNSDAYDDYYVYLKNQEAIDAACAKYKRIQEAQAKGSGESAGGAGGAEAPAPTPTPIPETMTEEEEKLRQQYVDVNEYLNGEGGIKQQIEGKKKAAYNHDSSPIDFDNTNKVIDKLGTLADELDKVLNKLSQQIENLKAELEECSEEVRTKIEAEIKDLEQVAAYAPEFRNTHQLIVQTYDDKTKNLDNKKKMTELLEKLDQVRADILSGDEAKIPKPKTADWPQEIIFEWGDFMTEKSAFYQCLKAQCEVEGSGAAGDKSAGDREIEHAGDEQKKAEEQLKKMEEEETSSARDISDVLAGELRIGGTSDGNNVPGLLDSFSGGLSFQALGEAGNIILDKFMAASYDFGMFSSRVSGVKPPGDAAGEGGGKSTDPDNGADTGGGAGADNGADAGGSAGAEGAEEYADYSLTKVKMSRDVNYLYGAELEYLFGGHNRSKDNLNEVRNIICGVRMTMNFTSTYLIDEVNTIISEISTAAMEAVAATGIGAPFAPLVKVAVSGALRMAFATIESVQDWQMLMERDRVVFLKRKIEDLSSFEALQSLLGDKLKKKSGEAGGGLELSYENYLYILLCLFVDHNTLLQRTSDLITLNVNQAALEDSTSELNKLDFKMENTVTAVKSTCKVKMDFVVIPDNFAELFLNGTETESKIEKLEDHYFGYTVIRGY